MALSTSGRLGCGRDVDDVWANINHEPDEHEATCPDCQAARADLAGLASATTAMVETDRDDERLVGRPGALAAIVAIARTEVRRGRTLALLTASPDAPGQVTISEQAVASIVRAECDGLDDVEGRRCRVNVVDEQPDQAPASVGTETSLAVELSLTVGRSVRIPPLVTVLRDRITVAIDRRVGVPVASIAIHVEDLHDD
ncbi:MAG: Asp23/Gls24 family envelope stress response protein [Terracoccus sp.]